MYVSQGGRQLDLASDGWSKMSSDISVKKPNICPERLRLKECNKPGQIRKLKKFLLHTNGLEHLKVVCKQDKKYEWDSEQR